MSCNSGLVRGKVDGNAYGDEANEVGLDGIADTDGSVDVSEPTK